MNQSPSPEEIREFVLAGHSNLAKVKQLLAERPALLNLSYEWQPGDTETALQAAAHMGNRAVAEYLLTQGAPLDICTAAMLGRTEVVIRFLQEDLAKLHATGAHGIPLLTHAALSGNVELARLLLQRGARAGLSAALSNAVNQGHLDMTRWLLEHEAPDVGWKNFQGKTVLEIALEHRDAEIAELLRTYGATSQA